MSLISYNGKPTVHNGKIIGPPTLIIADEPTITGDLTYNGSV